MTVTDCTKVEKKAVQIYRKSRDNDGFMSNMK